MQILDALISGLAYIFSVLLIALSALIPSLAPTVVESPTPIAPVTEIATSTEPKQAATSTPVKQAGQKSSGSPQTIVQPTSLPPPTAPPSTDSTSSPQAGSGQAAKSQDEVNTETRAALVNILCTTLYGGYLKPISGSGVVIDSRGVVLTNAHVGQYFLLRDYYVKDNIDCVVRVGSPAQARYTAKLLYLPPLWIADNASQITASVAQGTGENDYALLVITGTTDPRGALPTSFPHVPMESSYPDIGDEMLLAAYPAGFLSGELITKSLYASSAVTYVTQIFSFTGGAKVDLFSIGGTVLSQAGSSGGATVRLGSGKLAGIIATATVGVSTDSRDLRAITLSHVDSSLALQGQGGLAALLTGDVYAKANDFNARIAPALTAALEAALTR